jgi:hypothetical protein
MEDIILVTGCHRAKSWINVAFTQGHQNAGVSFNQASSDSRVYLEQKYMRGGELKLGPVGEVGLRTFLRSQHTPRHLGYDLCVLGST